MNAPLSIAAAAKAIAAKTLSPVELTQDCLARVRALDPALHSFLLVTEDRAMADARAAEARVMKGASLGKLDGIPIGHKDIYKTAGIRTTAHSRLLETNVPEADATSVKLLAEAGTVMMGKLATHEFAFGGPSHDLPWPAVRNPWNTEHFTAGSSSGTGAAVAAGLIMGGTGSDTGGSIRGPAALCGIAGIKPTYGLISRAGILPLAYTLDHAGPMAWTVEDCAIMLQAMAGPDAADPAGANQPIPDYTATLNKGVKGLRIGVIRHFYETDLRASPATIAAIDDAVDVLQGLGAIITDVTLSPLMEYHACGFLIMIAEAYTLHEPWLTTRFYEYGEMFRDRVALGSLISAQDYVQALRRRRELCREMAVAMADLDVVITASAPGEAPLITQVPKWGMFEMPNFTIPFNVTGIPAMSVCTGYGAGGLPLSMQVAGKPFDEAMVFRVGHAYEQATQWRDRRPAMTLQTEGVA
ncbi:amidase [Acidisphaera sp. L21]|uniref:amidase n=1 Tax=Acidisphaera sp. L21 TaxID=1641851 RepID=UPI00131D2132|nr:amidase [Acidisphaera sp. L21]